jgi:GT2 family glycosyltransferase
VHLEHIVQRQAGPAAARNAGAAVARGTFLAFTDDDCTPECDWLAVLERRLRSEAAAVGGRTVNDLDGNRYSEASQLVTDVVYAHYNDGAGAVTFLASNNLAIAAADFHELGGFDARFRSAAAEDRDFCDRCLEHGVLLAYEANAVVRHAHALTLSGLWSQHLAYGRGAALFRSARRDRGSRRQGIHGGFYLRLLRTALRRGGLGLATLAGLTQVAYAAGFVYEECVVRLRSGHLA